MAKERIFLSYDHENDARYKNLLHAWNKHDDFDIKNFDGSLSTGINSRCAPSLKNLIRPLITRCGYLLCIIGEKAHVNDWIDWELKTAIENKKKLICVKINEDYVSPPAILEHHATWTLSLNFDAIKKAIYEA